MVNLFYGWHRAKLEEAKKTGFKDEDPEGKKAEFQSEKTRVPSYPSIADALAKGSYGLIFTTPKSKDIYVVTRGTWGEKSKDKVVKSFPPGTPYSEIKGFSERTKTKHASKKHKEGSKGREESGFATKGKKDKVKNFKPVN